jgi:hypothetical protein
MSLLLAIVLSYPQFEPVQARALARGANRRTFYPELAKHIGGGPNEAAVWVSQNVVRTNHAPKIDGWHVTDGLELLLIGRGKCGQSNRVLVELLLFGYGIDARMVSTPGHAYVEWGPPQGGWRIIDADYARGRELPNVSARDLTSHPEDTREEINEILDGLPSDFIHDGAYVQKTAGPAWMMYRYRFLTKDGTAVHEFVSGSPFYYESPGHVMKVP